MYARQDPALETCKCPYLKGNTGKDPHHHVLFDPVHKKVYNDILETLGNTPLVKMNRIPQSEGLKC